MSVSVVVYSVPSGKLHAAVGSRDAQLKAQLRLGNDPQSRALGSLIDGERAKQIPATAIHAFERLCEHLGRALPTASFSATNLELLDRIDGALAGQQLPFSARALIYGGAPVPLPRAADFPTVGCIESSNVQVTATKIGEGELTSDDADVDAAFFDISEWVKVAAARGDMLVGFSY